MHAFHASWYGGFAASLTRRFLFLLGVLSLIFGSGSSAAEVKVIRGIAFLEPGRAEKIDLYVPVRGAGMGAIAGFWLGRSAGLGWPEIRRRRWRGHTPCPPARRAKRPWPESMRVWASRRFGVAKWPIRLLKPAQCRRPVHPRACLVRSAIGRCGKFSRNACSPLRCGRPTGLVRCSRPTAPTRWWIGSRGNGSRSIPRPRKPGSTRIFHRRCGGSSCGRTYGVERRSPGRSAVGRAK